MLLRSVTTFRCCFRHLNHKSFSQFFFVGVRTVLKTDVSFLLFVSVFMNLKTKSWYNNYCCRLRCKLEFSFFKNNYWLASPIKGNRGPETGMGCYSFKISTTNKKTAVLVYHWFLDNLDNQLKKELNSQNNKYTKITSSNF